VGWVGQDLTSNLTHFYLFIIKSYTKYNKAKAKRKKTNYYIGHFGDGGVPAASARIVATEKAHSVCGVE